MKKIYLTPKEVATLLSLTVEYVRKLANQGKLIAYRPTGNRLLFPSEQFENYTPIYEMKKAKEDKK